tara:strand:- start:1569 stop:3023 length:1455 start_codon:yes stop_codon:yes gene_type:complete
MTTEKLWKKPVFWCYGSAATAFGIKNNAFSYLLLLYCTEVLGIAGFKASIALAIAMIWDAVSDLLLGHWSDKTSSRLGRRHPFMYAALLVLPISFYLLFDPAIELHEDNAFMYVLLMCLLIRTGTTLFEMPSTALLPDLEKDYDRRNQWLSLRYFFGWYGGNGIHIVNMMFWAGAYGFAVQRGYTIYATVGALLIFLSIVISSFGTQREASALPRPADTFKLRDIASEVGQIFESLKNPNFKALFLYGLTVGIAGGLGMALYLYNTTYFFAFSGPQVAVTGLWVLVAPVCAVFAAPFFGARVGKKKAAIYAILLNTALYPIPYILVLTGAWPELGSWLSLYIYSIFIVVEVFCGIIGGVLLDSMMADVVEDSEVVTERRSEGLFFAARGFAGKAISAGGIVGAGIIVSLVGLDAITSVEQVTYDIRINIAVLFLPLYCLLNVGALYFVSQYRIDRDDHGDNLDKLAKRHGEDLAIGVDRVASSD